MNNISILNFNLMTVSIFIKERLHDVLSNEENLLNRIKSMEAEEAYGRTEVDKVLAKERDLTEMNQRLQYRVECLEGKLRQKNKAGKTDRLLNSFHLFFLFYFFSTQYDFYKHKRTSPSLW